MKREDTFPFWIMTLREYYIWLIDNNGEQTPELKRYKASLNPGDAGGGKCNSSFNSDWGQRYGNGGFHITNQVTEDSRRDWNWRKAKNETTWYYPTYDNYTIRILPPLGWLSLGDMMVSGRINRETYARDISYRRYTHTNGVTYDIGPRDIFDREIVFVKKDPIYAIPCDGQYESYVLDNRVNGSPCDSRPGMKPVEVGPNVFLNKDEQQKDTSIRESATCYKLTCSNQSYIPPGSRWGSPWNDTLQLYGAVNRVYLETISYVPSVQKKFNVWYWDGGALLANSDGTEPGCKYTAWSSVAYISRDGKKNGNIIDETADSTVDPGVLRYTSVFLASWGEYEHEWNQNFDGDGAAKILYLLHFDNTNKLCCSPNSTSLNNAEGECGFGTNAITPGSLKCADLYRKTCKFDSPEFTTNFCLKNGCKSNVRDDQNLIVCDYELKKFCNIIEDPKEPTDEKNKILAKRKPYQDALDTCNYQDEAKRIREAQFSDYTYTTDKRAIYNKICSLNWRFQRLNKNTGEVERVQEYASSVGEGVGGYYEYDEYKEYCNYPDIKKAFETADKDEKACADAKVVVDEFNKRMSFYDKKLENIRRSNEIGRNVNQLLYPDMCSCFASTKDLKEDCDAIADFYKIRNNKPAKKVLNLDTDDPLQCNQNCAVNPVCRAITVPSTYPEPGKNRRGKTVMRGFIQDKGRCEDKNLCIQQATINNQGKIGELVINQTSNCGDYKSKFCQNSVLSKCDTQNGQGLFAKRVIEDKDGGTCSSNLESLQCARFNLDPIFDSGCVTNPTSGDMTRTLTYRQTLDKVNKADAEEALKTLATPEMRALNPIYEYTGGFGSIITRCQNCEMGFELKSDCFLENGKWKARATKTKVLAQPYNRGTACAVDNSVQITDCTSDKDCVVSVKTPDNMCVSGKRSMTFNIDSYNSGNGKTCETAVLEKVPQIFKDNAVSVDIQDRTATASILCRDCVIDYKVDPNSNDGKCYFDGTKSVIKKIPYVRRQALNGGKCGINSTLPIIEECKFDQDCVFSDEPNSKEGLCIKGEKTFEFDVKMPPSNNGKSCDEVAKTFGSRFTKDTSKNVFLNNKLYVKTTCDKVQDCEIEDKPYQTGCDIKTGNAVDLYKILTPQKNGGKTCSEVFNETIDPNAEVSEDNVKVIVNKKCVGIDTVKSTIIGDKRILYGIIGLVVLILLILIVSLLL